jgi:hypothetical protein
VLRWLSMVDLCLSEGKAQSTHSVHTAAQLLVLSTMSSSSLHPMSDQAVLQMMASNTPREKHIKFLCAATRRCVCSRLLYQLGSEFVCVASAIDKYHARAANSTEVVSCKQQAKVSIHVILCICVCLCTCMDSHTMLRRHVCANVYRYTSS